MFVTSESLVSHATVLVSSALCYIFRGTHLMLTGTLFRTGSMCAACTPGASN
jgi:hypothetical protein